MGNKAFAFQIKAFNAFERGRACEWIEGEMLTILVGNEDFGGNLNVLRAMKNASILAGNQKFCKVSSNFQCFICVQLTS